MTTIDTIARPVPAALSLGALGVVFGDIGTSPLYALRETVLAAGGPEDPRAVLGAVSLILWALIISISVIYVNVILRVDNEGEGGILSLAALLRLHERKPEGRAWWKHALFALAVLGAAMLFGDAVITPAISVLSAVEGLNVAWPAIEHLIAPIAMGVLAAFFTLQLAGTDRIGRLFGPVMLAWFAILGALGLRGLVAEPAILQALDPRHALACLAHAPHGIAVVIAALFLAITGGEALYADLGQFGRQAIARAWFLIALPGLALTYLGQGALLLADPEAIRDPFYTLAPAAFRLPLVFVATFATIIASQAVITGIFGITRQAIQLGLLPPFAIRQTSDENATHVYIALVNAMVGLLALAVVWSFGSSAALADAYGLAVAFAMLATSTTFVATLRLAFGWSWTRLAPLAIPVVGLDVMFVSANAGKFASGGWLPTILALAACLLVHVWRRGLRRTKPFEEPEPIGHFASRTARGHAAIDRSAVFLAAPGRGTPSALQRIERLFNATFRTVIVVTVCVRPRPRVPIEERIAVQRIEANTWRVVISTGFMQVTNVPSLLGPTLRQIGVRPDDVIYVTGRDRIRPERGRVAPVAALLDRLFVFLTRNAQRSVDRFALPARRTLELGSLREMGPVDVRQT
ncbi:KUP/HAK/KT family potassium transporter [uncultured Jannaschia sp.]|uniref:KUP/HAK/KT family potassium transporter n=1 Tax=uncultured Jannaschia sp. TaxID=293347 RepID=UPI0026229E50|nr:KUP/HAK/KT family potassium transporter [uncultured Jannaschia sp.]